MIRYLTLLRWRLRCLVVNVTWSARALRRVPFSTGSLWQEAALRILVSGARVSFARQRSPVLRRASDDGNVYRFW